MKTLKKLVTAVIFVPLVVLLSPVSLWICYRELKKSARKRRQINNFWRN